MKEPLPNCKLCVHYTWVNWEWVCTADCNTTWEPPAPTRYKRINRRHSRSVARKCPEYRYWRDAFMNLRCIVIAERKEQA